MSHIKRSSVVATSMGERASIATVDQMTVNKATPPMVYTEVPREATRGVEQVSAEDAIRRTLALYPQKHDGRDAEGFAALFADDGRFFAGAGEFAGRTAILEWAKDHYTTAPA